MIVGHVDDLLFTGNDQAWKSFNIIGEQLGFSSLDLNDFVWCGKRIYRHEDGTIRLSMVEYHKNLKTIPISRERRKEPTSPLTKFENKAAQRYHLLSSMARGTTPF